MAFKMSSPDLTQSIFAESSSFSVCRRFCSRSNSRSAALSNNIITYFPGVGSSHQWRQSSPITLRPPWSPTNLEISILAIFKAGSTKIHQAKTSHGNTWLLKSSQSSPKELHVYSNRRLNSTRFKALTAIPRVSHSRDLPPPLFSSDLPPLTGPHQKCLWSSHHTAAPSLSIPSTTTGVTVAVLSLSVYSIMTTTAFPGERRPSGDKDQSFPDLTRATSDCWIWASITSLGLTLRLGLPWNSRISFHHRAMYYPKLHSSHNLIILDFKPHLIWWYPSHTRASKAANLLLRQSQKVSPRWHPTSKSPYELFPRVRDSRRPLHITSIIFRRQSSSSHLPST